MKLHLGSGTKRIEGFVNIDIRYLPGVDEVNNVKFLRNYKDNSIDLIYACHVLEHFGRWETEDVLRRWCELLKPGGILRLAVPNFSAICDYYNKTEDLPKLMGLLYGGQDYPENYHFAAFDFKSTSDMLIKLGFSKVSLYDWENTEHASIDDYSKAYIPHMSTDGTLMSLNIEAIK